MHLIEVLLDKRVSFNCVDTKEAENVIFCRPVDENLYNNSVISTRDTEFIHNFITESYGNNFLITDVCMPNGDVFSNVRFKLVVVENGELPYSTINTSKLGKPQETDFIPQQHTLIEEYIQHSDDIVEHEQITESVQQPDVLFNKQYLVKAQNFGNKIENEKKLVLEEQQIRFFEREINTKVSKLEESLEKYKTELLHEFYSTDKQQRSLLSKTIGESADKILNDVNEQFEKYQSDTTTHLEKLSFLKLNELKQYQDEKILSLKNEITGLLTEQAQTNIINVNSLLLERVTEFENAFADRLLTELETYKRNVITECENTITQVGSIVSDKIKHNEEHIDSVINEHTLLLHADLKNKIEKNLSESFEKKLQELNDVASILTEELNGRYPDIDSRITDITKKVETLISEKKAVSDALTSSRQYTDSRVQDAKDYARRILELGSGGGSNAVQYANGGVMNGDLNVTGQYLSGGINLLNILSGGGGGDPAVNSLVHNNSGNWDSAYANQSNYLPLNGGVISGKLGINSTPNYFDLDLTTLGNSYGDLGLGAWNNILINPNDNLVLTQHVGRVGIGVTDPVEKLVVDGNISTTGTVSANGIIVNTSASFGILGLTTIDSTGTITTTNGDSNQWNSAYTTSTAYQSTSSSFITAVSGTANQISASRSGSTVTLSLPNSATFPGDVNIIGNLTIAGSATYINTQNLLVGDNLIYFNNDNYGSNVLDIGIVSHFTQAPLGYNHTGLVRRAGGGVPGVWTLFSGLTTEPASAANIDWTDKNIRIDSLSANLIGNVTGNADTVTNGVYTNGSYSDPSWIISLADTKITGSNRDSWDSVYSYIRSTSATNSPTYNAATFAKLSAQVFTLTGNNNIVALASSGNNVLSGASAATASLGNAILGGSGNVITGGNLSIIGGGANNTLFTATATNQLPVAYRRSNVLVGGYGNSLTGVNSFLGGGNQNIISNGLNNAATAYGNVLIGGSLNSVQGSYGSIVGGFSNSLSSSNSFIAGGTLNTDNGFNNTFILGSYLSASQANFTYVNNISSQGLIYDATNNSGQWNSVYSSVNTISANSVSVYSTVSANSGSWNSAYSYMNSASSTLVSSNTAVVTNSSQIQNIVYMTQANYNALGTYNASTVYIIVG